MALAQHRNNRSDTSEDWQSLRSDLAQLLDQVEGQVAQAETTQAEEAYNVPPQDLSAQVEMQNPDVNDIKAVISKINMLKNKLSEYENMNSKAKTAKSINVMGNISDRLKRYENMEDLKDNKSSIENFNNNELKKINDQISQLTNVVELLSGAVGESGQVKRLESQISEIANLVSKTHSNNSQESGLNDINQRIENLTNNMQQLLELQALSTKSQKELEKNLANNVKRDDSLDVTKQIETLAKNVQQILDLQNKSTQSQKMLEENLKRENGNQFEDDLSNILKRIDILTDNIENLSKTTSSNKIEEFSATYESGLNSISLSIGNIYDRLEKIEKTSTLPTEIIERLFQEISEITSKTSYISENLENGQLNSEATDLISAIDILNDRLALIENKDISIGEIDTDIINLKEMIKDAIEPRFFNLQSKIDDLSEHIANNKNTDLVNELSQQIHSLKEKLNNSNEVSSNDKIGQEELSDEIRSAVAQIKSIQNDNSDIYVSKEDVIKKNDNDIEARLSQLKSKLDGYELDIPQENNILEESSSPDISEFNKITDENFNEEKALEPIEVTSNYQDNNQKEIQDTIQKINEEEINYKTSRIDEQSARKQMFLDDDIAQTQEILKQEIPNITKPSLSESQNPNIDMQDKEKLANEFRQKSYLGKQDEDIAKKQNKLPKDKIYLRPKSSQNETLEVNIENNEIPAAPISDFADNMKTPFMDKDIGASPKINSGEEPVLSSSKNTFIEAARRAANRQVIETSDISDSQSLIGRAFARFQKKSIQDEDISKPSKNDKKEMKKALREAKKQAKLDKKNKNSEPIEQVESNEFSSNNGFIARYTKPIIISVTLVVIIAIALNIIIGRSSLPKLPSLATTDINPPTIQPIAPIAPDNNIKINENSESNITEPKLTEPTIKKQIQPENTPKPTALGLLDNKQIMPEMAPRTIEISKLEEANEEIVKIDEINTASIPSTNISTAEIIKLEMPAEEVGPVELRQAAANGNAQSQFEVAAIYSEGKSLEQDFTEAAIWYERAAAQGFAPAGYRLGGLYEKGQGVEKNLELAKLWYQRAAEAGNRMAMHNLASIYASSELGEPNFTLALEWFERAAKQDLVDSQFNLGMLYARGLGTKQDLNAAYLWFSIASMNGDKDANKAKEDIARALDSDSVASIQTLAKNWKSEEINIAANFAPIGTWSENFNPGKEIINKKVTQKVQSILAALGYDIGTPDGLMGPRTSQAIKDFELETGMSVSGKINPRLLAVLGSQPV